VIADELRTLGPMTREEKCVAAVFVATAALWIFRPLLNGAVPGLTLSDPMIALIGALALFVIPSQPARGVFLLDWEWSKRLPWGVLILFGGGLSLASAIDGSGLARWISEALTAGAGWPLVAIVVLVAVVIVLLTEMTSNTATASVFLPLAASFAVSIAVDPFLLLVPVALAASCAFMMPVATPPNAIVFGSGLITIPQMARAGLALNVVAVVVIVAVTYSLVLLVFGVDPMVLPAWATAGKG
jgi:sodium-dependent dicarboxylate transporter 2/3/5